MTDASVQRSPLFRRPLYTDGAVMVPVVLGVATLVYFAVVAGGAEHGGGRTVAAYLLTVTLTVANGTLLAFAIAYLRQNLRRLLGRR